jgi:localization factor PodJL
MPQQTPREPVAPRGDSNDKPQSPIGGLPSMAASPSGRALQAPIAGSDPIVTGSITAPKNMAPSAAASASIPLSAPAPLLAPAAPAQETQATFQALRDHAEAGEAAAQYELATRYAEGKLVPRDLKIAADWYEKAATQGLAPAQYRLGSLYEKGMGVTRDLVHARGLYERAASQGHSHAMHNLAVLTAEGVEGKPDYATAAIWFRKAAEYGIRDSQYNLAILYARGLGVQQDLVQSYAWFAIAAAQGDDDAGKKREDVAMKLDPKALERAKAVVEAFRPREADRTVNEVQVPPGGWTPLPQAAPKAAPKAKISRL